jgi:hypothetical protein
MAALEAEPQVPLKIRALLCLATLHAEQRQGQVPDISSPHLPTASPARAAQPHVWGTGDGAQGSVWSLEEAERLFQRACEVRVSLDSSVRGRELVGLIGLAASGARQGCHWQVPPPSLLRLSLFPLPCLLLCSPPLRLAVLSPPLLSPSPLLSCCSGTQGATASIGPGG